MTSMASMTSTMDMSDMSSTMTSSAMPSSSTSSSMSSMGGMGGMDGSSMMNSSMTMTMQQMSMVFFSSTTTPLYSMAWTPTSTGQYAGTCIFLIVLAAILRGLVALRVRYYDILAAAISKRYGTAGHSPEKMANGAWRPSDAVLLAAMDVILAGVGYLLMLAVMTMNVGYFLSVLGGVFLGSIVFGQFIGNRSLSASH